MRVVVFGAGAVGGLFGAYLARAGHDVLLIARAPIVAAIGEKGLRITGRFDGTWAVRAAEVLPAGGSADIVLMTVKTFDLDSATAAVGRGVPPGTPILLLENGLGVLEGVRRVLVENGWLEPDTGLVRGINSVPATALGPGEIRAAGDGEVVLPTPEGPAADAVRGFERILRGAGLRVRMTADFPREVWRKAAVNAAINPVTAIYGIPNGRLLEAPYAARADRLLLEAAAVARAVGVPLSDSAAREDLERVVRATADNRSSMLQDVERNRPTEIEAISGAILRLGRERRLDMVETELVVAEVRTRAAEVRTPRGEPS